MSVSPAGAINTTALVVPGVYVQIIPPQVAYLNGLPTNILGVVGTATWGPVNSPTTISSMATYAAQFGAIQARKYDMGTAVAAAVLQGANSFRCVRVTDGTDTAATIPVTAAGTQATGTLTFTVNPTNGQNVVLNGTTITFVTSGAVGAQVNIGGTLANTLTNLQTLLSGGTVIPVATLSSSASSTVLTLTAGYNFQGTAGNALTLSAGTTTATASGATLAGGVNGATGLTVTSKYTGSLGNSITVTTQPGSAANSTAVIVQFPGQAPEKFDSITGSGNQLWINLANAINNGISGLRGPSAYVIASAGAATAASVQSTFALAGGTDGAGSVSAAALVGVDVVPRTGMYALRNTGASVAMLADCDSSATWSLQVAYGLSEGTYMVMVAPSGSAITNGSTGSIDLKAAAGIDTYTAKLLHGDWVYFFDAVNNQTRLVSPQGFVAGLIANMAPHQSSLNKPIYGIVGTQKSYANQTYAQADLAQLGQAGIDVIANPSPGGTYFSCQFGHNCSSNQVINTDSYTRMTNYIAYTLNAGMGMYVGKLNSSTTQAQAMGTVSSFLANLDQQGMIGDPAGGPSFSVTCNASNNPPSRVALGYLQIDCLVKYWGIVEKLLVNVQGGSSVQILRQGATPNT
ncbi:MAG: phage tail protein [Burkholderiales bacterium]|nr:phage tail protein [Burkholderiales bacterium]